jgi:hypothetical protein
MGVSVMREWWRGTGAGVVGPMAAAAVAGVIAGCASASGPRSLPPVPARPSAAATPKSVPYDLFTHCGIIYARVGNQYYEATPPLSDGSGNPPPGWGNPYQPGTLTLVSPTKAVFTDRAGHRVVFTLVTSGGHGRSTASVCA